jgi:hypothetical protein
MQFLDESIPKLKRKQQEDMRQNMSSRIYQMSQSIHKAFVG